MTTPTGQVAYFRVFPESTSRLHYRVRVFTSERALRAYLRSGDLSRSLGRYGRALCSSWQRVRLTAKGERLLPDMGEILLTTRWLGTEVLAHECTHAAVHWAQRIGLQPMSDETVVRRRKLASPEEERFCTGLGRMVRQLVSGLYARKLVTS